jgi:hypothetical protein
MQKGDLIWINYEESFLPEATILFSECPYTSKDSRNKSDGATVEEVTCVWGMTMQQNNTFWDVAPCGSGLNRRFGGKYRLHLQGR